MKQKSNKDLLIIAAKLLVICTIVAVIVAFVNSITSERIALNQKINTANALNGIYSEQYGGNLFEVSHDERGPAFIMSDSEGVTMASCDIADTELLPDVTALYIINGAGNKTDYCVAVSPMGFKDKINMLVAINENLSVKDVKIVSMSETSGIGTKVAESIFLSKFSGLVGPVAPQVDTISGATKSSKPVIDAVDTALNQAAAFINSKGGVQE